MSKQTAVEWLVEQLAKKNNEFQALTFYYDHKEEIEQAKQMEKEQIIDAHNYGFTEGTCFGASPIGYKFVESEQYYNETFNTKEK